MKHSLAGNIRFDLDAGSPLQNYCQSKIANVTFSNELARRYTDSGVISVSLNPRNIRTELFRHQGRTFFPPKHFIKKYPVKIPEVTKCVPWARKSKMLRREEDDVALGIKMKKQFVIP